MDQQLVKQQINDLYHSYSQDVYNFVFFMVGNHELAKDILQDTFLRAYKKYYTFQGGNIKSWLFRIARNITIDEFRKTKPISYLFDINPTLKAVEFTPEQLTILSETEKELYFALNKLKRSYRDVIILRKIKELSINETAEILGWSESKVKTTLFRGMSALKKVLEEEGYVHETL